MQLKMGIKELLAAAMPRIETLTIEQALPLLGDPDVQFVDIRDPRELERDGVIPGAFHAPRGMLEFWVDPESPYHKPIFTNGKRFVLYCGGGWRSALATDILQRMGLPRVCHIEGGYGAWKKAGYPTEAKASKPPKTEGAA